ncbi:MAG: hypothetical protein Q9167_000655 [Letrouitia subvulpina]
MNRFRSKKKAANDGGADTSRRQSTDSEVPALPIFSSKGFGRRKKIQPEAKPQIDLTTALPSSDDFRTSLLMPNLSARFSMLREQDDPESKLGKANDDSVLFPKRASRLDLFSHARTTEYSENDSINSSIRPPFANTRTDSYGSEGYGTDEDRAMMSRARPGEGNNMFGGRQKIYKIPIGASGSTKSFGKESEDQTKGMGGKALYGDDIAQSAFQKLREQERQNREVETDKRHSDESSDSPPLVDYNRNRETSSSTNSNARTSTAATSVASQKSLYGGHGNMTNYPLTANSGHGLERPIPKSRRLYGQGLDQHMYEQQSSAMHRLESLHRQRTMGGAPYSKNLKQSRSATNLNDRYQRSGALYNSNDFRAASPPPAATPPRVCDFDLGLNEDHTEPPVDSGYGRSPPLSPPMSPVMDKTFAAALEPNDLGKATASGAFNKPNQPYNEQQYLERQRQLQQGRESPSLVRPFSPSAMSIDEQISGRTRNNSSAGPQSRTGSFKRQQEPQGNAASGGLPEPRDDSVLSKDQGHPAMESSFLSNLSDNELVSPLESENEQDLFLPSASDQGSAKPAFPTKGILKKPSTDRMHNNERLTRLPEESLSNAQSDVTVRHQLDTRNGDRPFAHTNVDSPTLGPTATADTLSGLNVLIRSHLRNDSGQSSIYPQPSPGLDSRFSNEPFPAASANDRDSATFFRNSTWEPEGQDSGPSEPRPQPDADMPHPLSFRARQILNQAATLRHESPKAQQILGQNSKAQRVLGGEAPRPSLDNATGWQEQLRARHARGGSTETEKERESLANELAERRRMVQDNLKSFVESESRSSSPAFGPRVPSDVQKRTPFGILKSKSSKESLANKQDNPKKAMKMLGMGSNSDLTHGSPRPSQDSYSTRDETSRSRDHKQAHDGRRATSRFRTKGRRHGMQDIPQHALGKGDSPPLSSRERSNSEVSENQLGSRSGRAQNGTSQEIAEEGPSQEQTNRTQAREFSDGPRPVEELMASMANHQNIERLQGGRMRSSSRTNTHNAPGYFKLQAAATTAPPMQQQQQPHPSANAPYMLPPQPSTPNYSVHSAPNLHETSMFSNDSSSVPVMINPPPSSHSAYTSPTHRHHHHRRGNRKHSINKQDISLPELQFRTSSIDVVDLPPGASLQNGMEPRPGHNNDRPPIPPLNPRRKRTQTLLQALGRLDKSDKDKDKSEAASPIHLPPQQQQSATGMQSRNGAGEYEERSNFSEDEDNEPRKRSAGGGRKLRKSSSEGMSMKAKAKAQAAAAAEAAENSPMMPSFQHSKEGYDSAAAMASPTRAGFGHVAPHPALAAKQQHGVATTTGAPMF